MGNCREGEGVGGGLGGGGSRRIVTFVGMKKDAQNAWEITSSDD